MKRSCFTSALLVLSFACSPEMLRAGEGTVRRTEAPPNLASHITGLTGIRGGVCSLLGGGDGEALGQLAVELARRGRLSVHVWDPRPDAVDATRKVVDDARLYGRGVIAEKGLLSQLPYADNSIDLLVATHLTDDTLDDLSLSEILRVLCPRGQAVLGALVSGSRQAELSREALADWLEKANGGNVPVDIDRDARGLRAILTRPRPAGEGDWGHVEHGPDNNPVATDTLIKAPYMTQWLGRPYYIAMPAVTTAAAGRIFLATGHIAHHQREEPWLNTLMGRNGYNGTVLWTRKLPDGYLVHRSAFVAREDTLYMMDTDGSGCLLVDASTGADQNRIESPESAGPWKWMAIDDRTLFALVGDEADPPQTTIVRSKRTHWSWGELSPGYYGKRIPWGFGRKLVAYDLDTRKVLWVHQEETPIDSRGMVLGGGRIFVYCPDAHLRSLDVKTGKPAWTNQDAELRELIEQPGRGLSSTPGFRTMAFSLYTPEVLVYQAQTRMNVVAVSTRDGYLLWQRKKTTNNPNALYIDDRLVLGIGPKGSSLLIDPRSGKTLGDLGFAKRSCARLTATSDSLFCRGMPEGLTRLDRSTNKVLFNGAVRPSCNDGVIAANGLLYMGPWACDCNLTLMGRVVMCSAGSFRFDRPATEAERLEAGGGDILQVAPLETGERDWPTYRGNVTRSASSRAQVSAETAPLWTHSPEAPLHPSAATAAGGLVFYGADDGKVRALNDQTGALEWSFFTGGPILQPPTIWNRRAYVGSGDGYVYCLEARTGRLLWRFRAAPVERRISVYGALSSTWPVHSGVLVDDGIAYAAAGIIDYDGTYVYALDALTGKIKWQNNSTGHLAEDLRKGVSAQGTLTVAGGRLWMAGGNVISPAVYDTKTGKYLGPPPGNGSPRANRGEEIGVFRDRYIVLGGRLRFSAVKNVVNPGQFTAHVMTLERGVQGRIPLNRGKIPPAWDASRLALVLGPTAVPVWFDAGQADEFLKQGGLKRGQNIQPQATASGLEGRDTVALALAPNAVVAVCEHRRPGNLRPQWTVSGHRLADGGPLWQHRLPVAAIPGGLALDRDGRVIVVLEDGKVACFGARTRQEKTRF